MAANSGGGSGSNPTNTPPPTPSTATTTGASPAGEWNSLIKPFVAYTVGTLSEAELTTLLKTIIESEEVLRESVPSSHPHSIFYDVVTVLSTHILTASAASNLLQRSSFPTAVRAAKLLAQSLLARFPNIVRSTHPILNVKLSISTIQEFSSGRLLIAQEEVANMLALLKNQELPTSIQSTSPSTWDKESASSGTSGKDRRSRLDPAVLLYEQVTLPVISMSSETPLNELLAQEVLRIFQSLKASQKFVELCLALPNIKNLHSEKISLQGEALRSFYAKHMKNLSSNDLANLAEELSFVFRLLEMSLFAPLTSTDAHQLAQLGIATINAAFCAIQYMYNSPSAHSGPGSNAATASSPSHFRDGEHHLGVTIAAQAIWTQKRIINILKEDSCLSHNVWLNYSFAMSKILIHNFQSYMIFAGQNLPADSANKSKSSGPLRISLVAVQSTWNECIIAMSSLAVSLIQNFVGLPCAEEESDAVQKLSSMNLSAFRIELPLSNSERIKLMLHSDINEFEFWVQVLTLCYRKACRLKMLKYTKQKAHEESISHQNKLAAEERKKKETAQATLPPKDSKQKEMPSTSSKKPGGPVEAQAGHTTNEVDLEIEDENHSVSDLMTTEDEEDPDDDDDNEDDDEDDEIDIDVGRGAEGEDDNERRSEGKNLDDTDDEPILGKWFESVLSPPEVVTETEPTTPEKDTGLKTGGDMVGDSEIDEFINEYLSERSAEGFMQSALSIVSFLTRHIISNGNPTVQAVIKEQVNESTMSLIAVVLRDLDQERANTEIGAISTVFDESLNRLYLEFSDELRKFVQNLIAQKLLSPTLVTFFLEQLGIDIGSSSGRWSLGLYPRSLAVLVQQILLKSDKENYVVHILKRVLETLASNISCTNEPPSNYEDLPVEHAQTLVFLFHTLSLMQKKAIMIEASHTLVKVSVSLKGEIKFPHQVMSLSRLLLLFDYLIRQLYEPGLRLVNQVQYNLFGEVSHLYQKAASPTASHSSKSSQTKDALKKSQSKDESDFSNMPPSSKPLPPSRLFEDCTSLLIASTTSSDKTSASALEETPLPKFYNLLGAEPNYQESPKLDGLSLNFLMNKNDANHRDKMEYLEIITGLLRLAQLSISPELLKSCQPGVHYMEYLLTRLVFSLPPPYELLEKLWNRNFVPEFASTFYNIIWIPRLQSKVYGPFIRDTFSKQGLALTNTDDIISKTLDNCTTSAFSFKLLQSLKEWVVSLSSGSGSKCPTTIYAVEATLAYLTANIETVLNFESEVDPVFREKELYELTETILAHGLSSLRKKIVEDVKPSENDGESTETKDADLQMSVFHVSSISSSYLLNNSIASVTDAHLEAKFQVAFENMNATSGTNNEASKSFPSFSTTQYISDILPNESYIIATVNGHMKEGNNGANSYKNILASIVKFIRAIITSSKRSKSLQEKLEDLLCPLLLDMATEYLGDLINQTGEREFGKVDTILNGRLLQLVVDKVLRIVTEPGLKVFLKKDHELFTEELLDTLCVLLKQREKDTEGKGTMVRDILSKTALKESNGKLFQDLVHLLVTSKNTDVVRRCCNFLTIVLSQVQFPNDSESIGAVMNTLSDIKQLPRNVFTLESYQDESLVMSVTSFMSALLNICAQILLLDGTDDKNQKQLLPFLSVLLRETIDMTKCCMLSRTSGGVLTTRPYKSFCLVIKVLVQIANLIGDKALINGQSGHGVLFQQMTEWFYDLVQELDSFFHISPEDEEESKRPSEEPYLLAFQSIVEYMMDIGTTLYMLGGSSWSSVLPSNVGAILPRHADRESTPGSGGNISPPNELEDNFDNCESELAYEQEEEADSGGEESDDEGLNTKLCTYSITQKEFMTQHWYHCHTCGMVDGVGVCTICARVCHKGHDVTYAKCGSFFCDCGDRADGSCLAMVRRTGASSSDIAPTQPPLGPTSSTQEKRNSLSSDSADAHRPATPPPFESRGSTGSVSVKHSKSSSSVYQGRCMSGVSKNNMEELMREFHEFSCRTRLLTVKKLYDVVNILACQKTAIGSFRRVQDALRRLRTGKGVRSEFDSCDDLMVLGMTMSSQDCAFENIKMQYNGDQGAQVRQLVTSQVIRHNTITALTAPFGRRHFLAVSQDKNKVTILNLSAVLGGSDSSKKKLAQQRLATLTLPFMALTMATNPIRDDAIAVCGLKDCEIIAIGTGGSISSQLVLTTGLEGQNHIIRPLWLAGSETELAIITTDSVKIYDVGSDVHSPIYHFLIPSGKIRDVTFIIQEESRYIAIMGTDGRIYYEKLEDNTSAKNGAYYITNDINGEDCELNAPESNSSARENANTNGLSLYYSHTLKLLFYTYPNGKSYMGTIDDLSVTSPILRAVLITPDSTSKPMNLGLAMWTEVVGHPGLVYAMGTGGIPYVLLLTGKGYYMQEIRMPSSGTKLKPIDLVAVRYPESTNGKFKSSLLVLCDDGSLRVYDSTEKTDYWLSPRLNPQGEATISSSKHKHTSPGSTKHLSKLIGVNRRMSKHTKGQTGQLMFPPDFFEHCNQLTDVEYGGSDLLHVYNVTQLKNRLNNAGTYIVCTKTSGFNLEATCTDGSMVVTGVRVLLGSQDINKVPSYIQVFGRTITINMSRPRWFDIPLTREETLTADQKITITFGPSSDPGSVTIVDTVKIYGKSKEAFGWPEEAEDLSQVQAISSTASNALQTHKSHEEGAVERLVTSCLEFCELSFNICRREATDANETLRLVTKIYLENYSAFNSSCRSFMCSILTNKTTYYEYRDFAVYSRSLTNLMILDQKSELDIDPELFHHIVNCMKAIAVVRPQHILQYEYNDIGFGEMSVTRVIATLCSVFKRLINTKPKNPFIVPVDSPGVQRVESLAMILADIIYSLMVSDVTLVFLLSPYLISLLMSSDATIHTPVKILLTKRMHPKNTRKRSRAAPAGPSSPHSPDANSQTPRDPSRSSQNQPPMPRAEVDEPIIMMGGREQDHEEMQLPPMLNMNPLDEYMGDAEEGYPPVIDIQSDAEDEAMVELAIALSLQEQAGGAALAIQGIQDGLHALEELHQDVLNVAEGMGADEDDEDEPEGTGMIQGNEGGGESDDDARTASPPGSDDEALATEGSTMRNSERGGSGSSGSSNAGGSNVGRNSNTTKSQASNPGPSRPNDTNEKEDNNKSMDTSLNLTPGGGGGSLGTDMKPFKIAFLKALSAHVVQCTTAWSLIPLLQVSLSILGDLDGTSDDEIAILENLMRNLMELVQIKHLTRSEVWERNAKTEITFVVFRFLNIVLGRWKGNDQKPDNNWIPRTSAKAVEETGVIPFCKEMLFVLRDCWKESEQLDFAHQGVGTITAAPAVTLQILKPAAILHPPDFAPLIVKPYMKSHSSDCFEELPSLLSEMLLRIPYAIKKTLNKSDLFDLEWEEVLCEILQNRNSTTTRRQARKLLMNIADSRDNYHLLRDLYNLNYHLTQFYKLIGYTYPTSSEPTSSSFVNFLLLEKPSKSTKLEFKYSQLVAMVEHLNFCIEIATQRPHSWQNFCRSSHALQFIIRMSCTADESLTTAILTLLKLGIDGIPFEAKVDASLHKQSGEADRAEKSLAHKLIDQLDKRTLLEFLKRYLLEHPQLQTRWLTHSLMLGFFLTSDGAHQLKLVHALWELWAFVPAAGSRASQFVDILGYATLNNAELKSKDLRPQMNLCVQSIEEQGNNLLGHPNASIYSSLVPFVSVDGYYLESEPCEVCHNVDKAYSSQKLTSIKADSKFTAGCQVIKLTTTLNIIRLSMRLSEVKKVRMIKTMAIYYSPRNISIVDLKNSRNLWQMARKITLVSGQTDVKFDFSVPITAANLIIEFIDFYENAQATSETLQCPRCSASVPATPGVCSNCGENVFQCHKCRAINYDERDPFLCHSCGFCKYAKMDITLLAKSIVAVDPVENEEDHKKAETAISTLLEKADMTYKQQQQIKANLETMLQSIKERKSMPGLAPTNTFSSLASASSSGTSNNNNNAAQAPSSSTPAAASSSQHHNHSYAAVAAAANALNNNLVALNIAGGLSGAGLPGTLGLIGSNGAHQLLQSANQSSQSANITPTNLVLKNVQSLAYCYAIDCKNSYEELNRLMRKVAAFRKEMLKLDPTNYALDTMDNVTSRKCYGCMASGITLSLKLLQALITASSPRDPFQSSFLTFLLRLSQCAGSTVLKEQVKNALCFFVKDDFAATTQLTDLINTRVVGALSKETWADVSFETAEEISLLSSLLQMYDSCWEIKLRSLMKIFTHAIHRLKDPSMSESGVLPCLKIIQHFIRSTQNGDKATVKSLEGVSVDLESWLAGNETHSFENWKKRLPKIYPPPPQKPSTSTSSGQSQQPPTTSSSIKKRRSDSAKKEKKDLNIAPAQPKPSRAQLKQSYYIKKYGRAWLDKLFRIDSTAKLEFTREMNWMKKLIFCTGSIQTRATTAALLKDLAQTPSRRVKIMELLTSFMDDMPTNGESCREFMELYRDLAAPGEYSAFLNVKGALNIVCKLLDAQIEKLHHLETVTLHSDLSQGVSVYELSRLLSTLAITSVRRTKRVSLLSTVLGGYLALKRLRLHRTRPIEEAQEILLQLLEEITSGTEEETKVFMTVCVETLKKCPKEDLATPVFVFERLCSMIVHEESDVAEFYVILDKDPQQEDFLQGRMLGNPYSSTENGLGPLMRDVKNKICTDCELVALLEDDNGMELLVNNKIISLDLPVKEVYKKLWVPTNGQGEPMRVVYRMRGLLGDATEEFVETFATPSDSPEDNETTYKLANVLVQCGGLQVVLNSLQNLLEQPFVTSKGKPFIAVILKLVTYCVKIKVGRKALIDPSLNAVQTLLPVLKLCLEHDLTTVQGSSGVVHLTDQVLEILDFILSDACLLNEEEFSVFAKSRGSIDDIKNLLNLTDKIKSRSGTLTLYLKVLGCLTYQDKDAMSLILDSYKDCCEFFRYDEDPNSEFSFKLEQFCNLVTNIQTGPYGATFKDLAMERSTLEKCLHYLRTRAPNFKTPLGRPDSDEWKEMATKPALKYVLRLLAGFASNHSPIQEALSEYVCVIHQLEQVSSDEHVGSLAENALEALRSHEKIWREVEAARRSTREEKKRMAMAMRERQLNTMGMKTNERGQVTTAISSMLDQMEDLAEEAGLVCVICREGYKYQPTKVLGIYTFSKKCLVEDADTKARKTFGYCTVSHFNVVHIDCHMAAIRLARSRDEWESASLQNGNTRCNGLIPLWGPQVPESAFAACLARHNAYLQEATANRDVGFSSGVHDIKLLLVRFAEEKSFHEDTGGGGPESNLHLIPYLIHTALYVLNTTRASTKESNFVDKFLGQPPSEWKGEMTTIEGSYYLLVVALMVHPPSKFMDNRFIWLKRVMASRGYRTNRFGSAEFSNYRPGLIFLGLIYGLYTVVFKDVSDTGDWSNLLADYIRRNDEALIKTTSQLLGFYQQKLLAATCVEDFVNVLGLSDHQDLKNVAMFTTELWNQLG